MAKKSKRTRNILLIIAGVLFIGYIVSKSGAFKPEKKTEVETTKVSRRTILETVNANGKLQPETEVKISADISGQIIELKVKEGDKVKQGDLLVRIKPDEYQRQVERAEAAVNSANATLSNSRAMATQSAANLEKVRLAFERNKKLYDQKAISQSDYENIQTEYNVAKAQAEGSQDNVKAAGFNLASSSASLKEAQYALSKTSIYAPMDGTISRLNVELGERVVGTMQMAGTEMMRLANLSLMEAEVEVTESDIVRLMLNDTADVEVDAFRGDIFKGVVTSIANSSATANDQLTSEKVTNFKVKIRLIESSYKHLLVDKLAKAITPFRPGMSANVEIHTRKAENVVSVPILAVTVRGANGGNKDSTGSGMNDKEVVFIYNNGKVSQHEVKTGIQDDNYIEIKTGLKEGEEVVSAPYTAISKLLKDGDQVEKAKGKLKPQS